MKKEMRQLLKRLTKLGVQWTKGGKHVRVETPRGPVFLSVSPSCKHATKNAISDLRRRGVDV